MPLLPKLQRPDRELAIRYARQLLLAGERVDMKTLAETLGIGRTTLYRWVGDREQLISEVLATLSDQAFAAAADAAQGQGLERALDEIRQFMLITANFGPLRTFAEREPHAALRVLLSDDGAIARLLRRGFRRILDRHLADAGPIDDEIVEIIAQLATALEWAPITIGNDPGIDRAIELMRSLLQQHLRPERRRQADA